MEILKNNYKFVVSIRNETAKYLLEKNNKYIEDIDLYIHSKKDQNIYNNNIENIIFDLFYDCNVRMCRKNTYIDYHNNYNLTFIGKKKILDISNYINIIIYHSYMKVVNNSIFHSFKHLENPIITLIDDNEFLIIKPLYERFNYFFNLTSKGVCTLIFGKQGLIKKKINFHRLKKQCFSNKCYCLYYFSFFKHSHVRASVVDCLVFKELIDLSTRKVGYDDTIFEKYLLSISNLIPISKFINDLK